MKYFDNTKLTAFSECPRKGFWSYVYGGKGVVPPPSGALRFGTCIHEGLAEYYRTGSESDCVRAFAREWETLFKGEEEMVQDKHSLESGLLTLSEYCAFYSGEDPLYEVMEVEIGGAYPLPDVDAIYQGRSDGIWLQKRSSDLLLVEHKTTSMGVDREVERLSYSQQVEGYVWLWSKLLPKYNLSAVMGNAIAVLKKGSRAKRFSRQYYHIHRDRVDLWLWEAQKKIRDIQLTFLRWEEDKDMRVWTRNTSHCFRYGRCPYMDLCQWGPFPEYMERFVPNEWDPLATPKKREEGE